jgi:hypothetical protein
VSKKLNHIVDIVISDDKEGSDEFSFDNGNK